MATFLTIRYGPRGSDGLRPNTLNLAYPLWTLDEPPRRVQRERLLEEAVDDGSYVDHLGQDPVTFTVKLLLRPSEQPGTRSQDELNRVRRVTGNHLSLEIGSEDWGDGWRLKDLREEYRTFNFPLDTGPASGRTPGGISVAAATVELVLVKGASAQETVGVPAAPQPPTLEDLVEDFGEFGV